MDETFAKLIKLIHILIILYVIIIPFTNSKYLLLLHSVFVPFMILHWVTNNNTCVLTTVERQLRSNEKKLKDEDCFTCQLIEPIFDFKKNYSAFSTSIYILTIALWSVSSCKLYRKYKTGEITKLKDLFII